MRQEMMAVLSNEMIAQNVYEMTLSGVLCCEIKEAGQFIHIKLADQSMILRRPISVSSYDENTLTILYKVLGKGTDAMTELKNGDVLDVLGPLGNGFKLGFLKDCYLDSSVLIVGAGIGIAPLYELALKLKEMNIKMDVCLSYKTASEAYYVDKFSVLGNVFISTDDGSLGMKGYAEDLVKTLDGSYSAVFSCGPRIVLSFVQEYFSSIEHVYVSLEERMACGFGACYGCDTKDKKKRVCKEGPVFNSHEVAI